MPNLVVGCCYFSVSGTFNQHLGKSKYGIRLGNSRYRCYSARIEIGAKNPYYSTKKVQKNPDYTVSGSSCKNKSVYLCISRKQNILYRSKVGLENNDIDMCLALRYRLCLVGGAVYIWHYCILMWVTLTRS